MIKSRQQNLRVDSNEKIQIAQKLLLWFGGVASSTRHVDDEFLMTVRNECTKILNTFDFSDFNIAVDLAHGFNLCRISVDINVVDSDVDVHHIRIGFPVQC